MRGEVELPRIVSLDDHVIEPSTVWTSRLPPRLRESGPRVVRLPAGDLALSGARYLERPGTEGPLVDYWVYEDLFMSVKRLSTAVGVALDQVSVKAKTAEKMGPVGEGLAIEARAVCLLFRS